MEGRKKGRGGEPADSDRASDLSGFAIPSKPPRLPSPAFSAACMRNSKVTMVCTVLPPPPRPSRTMRGPLLLTIAIVPTSP
ncbi:hypothetical protein EVG20_g6846 [Dentipellis fragilis]|uniref:Uncharacterized protein n=1 Tax=Dentipellis fragilis TaxID=205917 RepID=A0A4Y9YK89_9AGAM|nr:hypothetical protein EVG20_g6846 [Dentipellis fragilis]